MGTNHLKNYLRVQPARTGPMGAQGSGQEGCLPNTAHRPPKTLKTRTRNHRDPEPNPGPCPGAAVQGRWAPGRGRWAPSPAHAQTCSTERPPRWAAASPQGRGEHPTARTWRPGGQAFLLGQQQLWPLTESVTHKHLDF